MYIKCLFLRSLFLSSDFFKIKKKHSIVGIWARKFQNILIDFLLVFSGSMAAYAESI